MSAGRIVSLWAMMLLQYAIWGAWAVAGGKYMGDPVPQGLGFDGGMQGVLFGLLPLASIFCTPVIGQFADRYFDSGRILAVLHLVGGLALYNLASAKDYTSFFWLMLAYSACYAPTLALTNSIVFVNLSDSTKQFGAIRVAGTIGWIIAGLVLTAVQSSSMARPGDLFLLAAAFSIALGLMSFFLPKTPPTKDSKHPLAFLEALQMLKNRDFLIFMICAFVVGTELEFYYIHTGAFLGSAISANGVGIPGPQISTVMTIGQFAEIAVMLALPLFVKWLGMRNTIVVGIIAWPIRYAIFALAPSSEIARNLVVPSLALHGFCYVFFFVAGFIYVDKVAPVAIRASAQALIAFVVLGLGRWLGSLVAGSVQGYYTTHPDGLSAPALVQWDKVFLVPCVLTIICAIIFPILFRGSDDRKIDTDSISTHA
ncbi:MAG: MFS transporter [Fimbriimonas sp.]